MENGIYIALSRQAAVQREMDVIANNVANANTDGYKREQVMFREYIEKPKFRETYSFVDDVGTARDMTPGDIKVTNRLFDLNIGQANGFFAVQTPMGERYTRHGSFVVNSNGQLATSEGYLVLGTNNGPIDVPDNSGNVVIDGQGNITSAFLGPLGSFKMVSFDKPAELRRGANGIYIAQPQQQPQNLADAKLTQGVLEGSNVSPIIEITRMMSVARDYEAITRYADKEDERIGKMMNTVGTPFGG